MSQSEGDDPEFNGKGPRRAGQIEATIRAEVVSIALADALPRD
jgi:hypothetical protein